MSSSSSSVNKGTPKENIKLIKILSILYGTVDHNKWLPGYVFPICRKETHSNVDRAILMDILDELNIKYSEDDNSLKLCDLINDKIGDYSLTDIISTKISKLFTSVFKNFSSTTYLQHTVNLFHTIYSIPVFRVLMFKKNVDVEDIKYIATEYPYKEADMIQLLANMLIVIKKIVLNLERALKVKKNEFNIIRLGGYGLKPDFWYNSTFDERQKIIVLELINKLQHIIDEGSVLCKKLLDDHNAKLQIEKMAKDNSYFNYVSYVLNYKKKYLFLLAILVSDTLPGAIFRNAIIFVVKVIAQDYIDVDGVIDIFTKLRYGKWHEGVDPNRYYCTRPYDRSDTYHVRLRSRSCEKGRKPHPQFKNKSFQMKQTCIEHCYY